MTELHKIVSIMIISNRCFSFPCFLAMVRCLMKYDGHLVVNQSFETNDEHVYAAGSIAKFDRYDFFDATNHWYFDHVEIGAKAAVSLMRKLNIVGDGENRTGSCKLARSLSVYCQLPGTFNYLHCAVPGLKFFDDASAVTLKTGNADDDYFEMLVDNKGVVLELSCYSKRVSGASNGQWAANTVGISGVGTKAQRQPVALADFLAIRAVGYLLSFKFSRTDYQNVFYNLFVYSIIVHTIDHKKKKKKLQNMSLDQLKIHIFNDAVIMPQRAVLCEYRVRVRQRVKSNLN